MIGTVFQTVGSMSINIIPNDPDFELQWYLHNIGQTGGTEDADIDAPEVWDIEMGSSDIVIAIIDSGIDYNHPDLADNIWINEDEIPDNSIDDDNNGYIDDIRGWNFYDNNSDPKDLFGHGTHCAGIAAAVGNNGIGIAGVTWNCKIMPLRETDEVGLDSWPAVIKAFEYAVDNGADIISLSIGGYADIQNIIEDAINYAYDRGVFLCAAAGNDNRDIRLYPAAFENVVAVGGTFHNDERSSFSTYGEWVDIAAPGTYIYSTMPTYHVTMNDLFGYTETYSYGSGTSYSAPQVAGVAALLLSIDPILTPDELKELICSNADSYIDDGRYIGTGRLNAQKAVAALIQSQLPPNTPTINGETNGAIETSYDYTIQTIDPEGHDVRYFIDWGDSTTTSTGLNESGKQIIVQHMWADEGTYSIKVKAFDKYGSESDWATLEVNMPKIKSINNFNLWISRLIERFPILELLL
jgi:subtilisin family serine protease